MHTDHIKRVRIRGVLDEHTITTSDECLHGYRGAVQGTTGDKYLLWCRGQPAGAVPLGDPRA
jgi:hypothetical protein